MDTSGLRVRVVTENGWAIQHAVITVTDLTGQQIARDRADADGVARTGPLPPGSYTAIVTAVGYMPSVSTAMVGQGGAAELGRVTLAHQGGAEPPPPGPWTIDPAHSSVVVTARHLGLSSIHARFTEFGGTIEVAEHVEHSRVAAEIKAATVDTANTMRDDHLRRADFLDVERFPLITYTGTHVVPAGNDRWTVHGELSLKDVRRPVELDLRYLGTGPDPWGGTRAAFRATTELRRSDFSITYNQILSAGTVAIGTTLRVELDIQAVQGERLPQG
ncbi:YceI family protein [Actinomadura alba]|uniref:YceI family protein n=1 Tax=Actinomadura alba TaxID=406431 RepID=A0ABR7LPJ7_9ACTN|nr:YceI family protein [Actinomadura alba]MBC6466746.1 YceI family protein [Actinomadura alba]